MSNLLDKVDKVTKSNSSRYVGNKVLKNVFIICISPSLHFLPILKFKKDDDFFLDIKCGGT